MLQMTRTLHLVSTRWSTTSLRMSTLSTLVQTDNKMKSAAVIVITLYCVFGTNFFVSGDLMRSQPSPLRAPGACYEDHIGHVPPGKWTIPGRCVQVTCTPSGDMTFAGCPQTFADPHCFITGVDLSKPYPACCPRPAC
ncbi:uncharacterized protein LOC135127751 [Zophobas morio]|uniref:uncharacterized protein LOC135127751 n=1 Tax=Zophobas morio TaxID=2755281 RepID=UPI003082B3C0